MDDKFANVAKVGVRPALSVPSVVPLSLIKRPVPDDLLVLAIVFSGFIASVTRDSAADGVTNGLLWQYFCFVITRIFYMITNFRPILPPPKAGQGLGRIQCKW